MSGSRTYDKNLIYEELTTAVASQLKTDVERLVGGLFGSSSNAIPGASSVPEGDLVQLTQRNWDHQSFRERLLQSIGPEKFLDIAGKAGFLPSTASQEDKSAPTDETAVAATAPQEQTDLYAADAEGLN